MRGHGLTGWSAVMVALCIGACAPDAGHVGDAGAPDAGHVVDAGALDAGHVVDAGASDAGHMDDAGAPDAGHLVDAGTPDAGHMVDAGAPRDAGPAPRPSATCGAAPTVAAPMVIGVPRGAVGPHFLRVEVPPHTAAGVFGAGPHGMLAACGACTDVMAPAGSGCSAHPVPPVSTFAGGFLPRGHPLFVNTADVPSAFVVAARGVTHIKITYFAPLVSAAVDAPCTPVALAPGEAAVGLDAPNACGAVVTMPAATWGTAFGAYDPIVENVTADAANVPVGRDVTAVAVGLSTERGLSCAAPHVLLPGTTVLRIDVGNTRGPQGVKNGACLVEGAGSGGRVLRVEVPAQHRAVLTVAAGLIADGGGNVMLGLAEECAPSVACQESVSQPWVENAPPATLMVENATDAPVVRFISVHQNGPGYPRNHATLTLQFEALEP